MSRYFLERCLSVDKSFIDIVQKAFNDGKELDLTLVHQISLDPFSSTPLVKPPSNKSPTTHPTDQNVAPPAVEQGNKVAFKNSQLYAWFSFVYCENIFWCTCHIGIFAMYLNFLHGYIYIYLSLDRLLCFCFTLFFKAEKLSSFFSFSLLRLKSLLLWMKNLVFFS